MPNTIAYGFMSLKDRMSLLVSQVGPRVVNDAILETLRFYNEQLQEILDLFTFRTTEHQLRYQTFGQSAMLQPLDEYGRARPIKPAVGFYDVAWPIYMGGTAWGATYLERVRMTVQDANNTLSLLLIADREWMRKKILSALFTNTSWQFTDPDYGELTIKGLANGDSTVYPYWVGSTWGNTDNHYLFHNAQITDADNPFPAIYTELTEHEDNDGEVIVFVGPDQTQAVLGLATFTDIPDANLDIPNTTRIVGSPEFPGAPGRLLGYESSKVWIYEWRSVPAGYLIAMTSGGQRPLAIREDEEPALRGFFQAATREDYPFWEAQYLRRAGVGGWNRTAALVMKINSASYTPPTNYGVPAA